jgi:hypothetical protein
MDRRLAGVLLAGVVLCAGCGEKPEPSTSTSPRAVQSQAGGGGDEEPIAQRVRLTVGNEAIRPKRATVDAFLGIRLLVRNESRRRQTVSLVGAKPKREISVDGRGGQGTLDLVGRRPGRVRVKAEPAGAQTVVVIKKTTP